MNRPQFTLESVLVLRRFKKVQAAGELANATRVRLTREEELNQVKGDTTALEDRFRKLLDNDVRAGNVLMLRQILDHSRLKIEEHRKALLKAKREEQECRDVLLRAQAEEKAVLRLKAKHREEFDKELRRADERASEDFTSARRVNNYISI